MLMYWTEDFIQVVTKDTCRHPLFPPQALKTSSINFISVQETHLTSSHTWAMAEELTLKLSLPWPNESNNKKEQIQANHSASCWEWWQIAEQLEWLYCSRPKLLLAPWILSLLVHWKRKMANHLFTQSTFLTATDCLLFFSPAHQFEPEVNMFGLSFTSFSSTFWNPWTAFLAWIMSLCTYTSYRIKLTPFLSYTLQFYTS